MPATWTWTLVRIALALLGGALIGLIYGEPAVGALLVALAYLGWHLYNLYRLDRWLATGEILEIPDGEGIWPGIFAKILYIRAKSRQRRKRFRRLLKELRASTEAFPDGGVILGPHNEILNYNGAARLLLGLKGRRDRGQRIENLLRHPDFVAYLRDPDARTFVEIPSPLGGEGWLACRLIPYGPEQSLLLIRDVSERLQVERMRRDFVANASHELRSPLTVIAGYLDAMEDAPELPPAWRQPVDIMKDQTDRMRRLVDDLLQLSKLESGSPVPRHRAVDVAALLARARKEAEAQPDPKPAIEIRLDSPAGILGDETELQSVVSNLVSNAVRYTPADGSITISWEVDEQGGHLSVRDTGIGIAEEEIPRITERFYRTDAGRARQNGGTGLGLAIVKHALRRHDADLEIRSRPGQGSTFSCHFPRDRLAVPQELS